MEKRKILHGMNTVYFSKLIYLHVQSIENRNYLRRHKTCHIDWMKIFVVEEFTDQDSHGIEVLIVKCNSQAKKFMSITFLIMCHGH